MKEILHAQIREFALLKVDIWGRSFFDNFYISSLANSPNYILKGTGASTILSMLLSP